MKKEVRTNELLPINLQFFAEDAAEGADEGSVSTDGDAKSEPDEGEPSKSYEDALSEIAAVKAEAKKLKAERDAALKKTGEISKQLRAKMSEDELKAEQDAQAKEEKEAHIKELEQYKAENEALKRYRLQGMSDELAAKAAKAEIEGDMDALADVQKQHTQSLIKAKEAEWKASRPRVNVGDDEDSSMNVPRQLLKTLLCLHKKHTRRIKNGS